MVFQKLINMIPPHERFIESHLGGGSVIKNILPAPLGNIGIEPDEYTIRDLWSDCPAHINVIEGFADYELVKLGLRENDFVYCDPPYLPETRTGSMYRYEMAKKDHVGLLIFLKLLPCKVMLSGYRSELYMTELEDWRLVTFMAQTRGNTMKEECVWMNYPEPTELHDYRYLGDEFRERERIQKKVKRNINKFQEMPLLERKAIMAALNNHFEGKND